MNLDEAVRELKGQSVPWDQGRESRVLASVLHRREVRARRGRAMHRALLVAGGATLMVLLVLRGASAGSSAAATSAAATSAAREDRAGGHTEALAARSLDDAGYGRD